MTAYDVYKKLKEKAEEVTEARKALIQAHDGKGDMPSSWLSTLQHFHVCAAHSSDRDIEKDERRAVKLLYKDYCTLRDELRAMLAAEYDAR